MIVPGAIGFLFGGQIIFSVLHPRTSPASFDRLYSQIYTGCHKYVPFARFPNRRTCRVQRVEIITNLTTAMLERLDQAVLAVIDNPDKTQQTTATGTLF
jgi:hypothetical protein